MSHPQIWSEHYTPIVRLGAELDKCHIHDTEGSGFPIRRKRQKRPEKTLPIVYTYIGYRWMILKIFPITGAGAYKNGPEI
mgnify:CR=1 FL=1